MPDFSDVRALTFDCYGTLIDWESGILKAVRPILSVRGIRAEDSEIVRVYAALEAELEGGEYLSYRDVLGGVMSGIAEKFGISLEDREIERLAGSIVRWEPFSDTVDSLRRLAARFRLAVCSNIDDDLFEATREQLRAGAEFEWVVTASYCRSYKPDPRHFRVAMALMDLKPEQILHVAQSRYHDIASARRLGMRTCWVNRPSIVTNLGVTPGHPPESEPEFEVQSLQGLTTLFR